MGYYETSAKEDTGVTDLLEDIFEVIIENKLKQMQQGNPEEDSPNHQKPFELKPHRHSEVGNKKQKEQQKKGCC